MLLLPFSLSILSFFSATFVTADPIHVPLVKRNNVKRDLASIMSAADNLRLKYGYAVNNVRRRGAADIQIIDQGQDSSYFATMDIGTPPQTMGVVLDTGSSDLWVAGDQCTNCISQTPLFQTGKSSSFQQGQGGGSRVQLTYGSGQVAGTIARDTVAMSGFSISKQIFVAVDQVSSKFLEGSISGILGLAFPVLAQTQATPFWLALINGGQLTNPEMSFFLARLVDKNNVPSEAPGGVFTLGGTNSSLFTGDIEFLDLVGTGNTNSFWLLTLSQVTVQGKTIPITKGDSAVSAIDTGTTLVGGPSKDVAAIYNAIPGSQALRNSGGLFAFPCDTAVTITMSFGGKAWPISSADMIVGQVGNTNDCIGGIFDLAAGTNIPPNSGNPSWVVGDTFLKNVYSVFRSNPPSVGFAQLSSLAGGTGAASSSPSASSVHRPTSTSSQPPPTVIVTATVTPGASPTGTGLKNYNPPSVLDGKAMIVTLLTSLVVSCFI